MKPCRRAPAGAGTTIRSKCSASQSRLQRVDRRAAALDPRVDRDAGAERGVLDRLEQRHRHRRPAAASARPGAARAGRRSGRPGRASPPRRGRSGSRRRARSGRAPPPVNGTRIRSTARAGCSGGAAEPAPQRAASAAATRASATIRTRPSPLGLLAQRPVGDDADVDARAGRGRASRRASRAGSPCGATRRACRGRRRSSRARRRTACTVSGRLVALELDEVRAEDAREPAERRERRPPRPRSSSWPGRRTQTASISEPSRCPERKARRRIRCERGSGVTSDEDPLGDRLLARAGRARRSSAAPRRPRRARAARARAAPPGCRAGRSCRAPPRPGRARRPCRRGAAPAAPRGVRSTRTTSSASSRIAVGERLAHADAGELEHLVVQALEVLDVDGRGDADPRLEDLVDVLVALGVAGLGQVRVRELVDERELRARARSPRRRPSRASSAPPRLERRCGHDLEPLGERRRLGPVVGLEVADHDVDGPRARPAGPPGASGRSCRRPRPFRAGSGSGRARRPRLRPEQVVDDEVDQLDPDEGQDHAAEAVDEQVAAQERGRADRAVADALQRERDERGDDQRVEDDRRDDRALRACRGA